jgi:uncharacterized protein
MACGRNCEEQDTLRSLLSVYLCLVGAGGLQDHARGETHDEKGTIMMEISERAIHLLAEVATKAQAYYRDFADLAHGWEHVQRVYHLALHLAEQEQADGFIVGMAALLHDLGRTTRGPMRSHAERSAKLAKKLLAAYDLPHETQHAILHAILAHSYCHGVEPATLEARVLYDADRLDRLGASGVMRWAMTTKHGPWPETRTYHPDDPFALWREPDGQRYLLDRFFTKLLKLQEAMTTTTGRAMAARRIAFLHLYLQELQHELAEGGSGYDMSEEVTYDLLWGKYRGGEEQEKEQPVEDLQRGGVIDMPRLFEEQHSA